MLDPRIIMAGQGPNVIGSFSGGVAAGQQARQAGRQNALADLYQTQGAGIANGDPTALNALAGLDPMASLQVQGARQDMDAQKQSMAMQAEQAKRAAAEYARGLSAEQRQAEAAKLEQGLSGAAFFYSKGDQQGYEAFLSQNGIDPAQFPFEAFPAHAATMGGVLDVLKGFQPEAPKPLTTEAKLAADFKAGLIDEASYNAGLARLAPRGTSLTIDPTTNAVTFKEGVGVTGKAETVGDVYTPGTPDQAVSLIDDILANPSLSRITGPIEGGGGNNIDEISPMMRAWYGEQGLDAIDKTNQLQSQAWMAARAMLKGGGQITDYESRKAEAAVARLSRAKGEKEFRAALTDLRDAITEGKRKLDEARAGGVAPSASGSGSQGLELSPEAASVYEKYRSR